MNITASVRPRGLKRGVSNAKLASLIGCESLDLRDVCGRLQFSATYVSDFRFLAAMWWVTQSGGTITVRDKNGRKKALYTNMAEAEKG